VDCCREDEPKSDALDTYGVLALALTEVPWQVATRQLSSTVPSVKGLTAAVEVVLVAQRMETGSATVGFVVVVVLADSSSARVEWDQASDACPSSEADVVAAAEYY
jgi:hypothetical protein